MIIQTSNTVALRCPECGKIKYHTLSFFSFAGKEPVCFDCDCGAQLLSIATKDRKVYYLQLDCLMCETKHLYRYLFKDLWSSEVLHLFCEETGLGIGFIGPRQQVRKCIAKQERSLREMAEDLGFSDYFENPEAMYEILDDLHKLAAEAKLSCQCGNVDIEVEVFADHVELRCSNCDAVGIIGAESEEDRKAMKNTWEITLQTGSLQWLCRGKGKNRRRKSKE
jgi:predicted RNA-binding Zn-ribbon protein involved in translation (DUF1610 family)